MRVSKENENYYISLIRRLIVIDHRMTVRELREHLLENSVKLEDDYIYKLRNKIYRQRAMQADRVTLNMALGKFADALSETTKQAWQIAVDKTVDKRTRVAALKEVREAEKDLFDKLFDAGVFQRKLGEVNLNVIRNRPLSPETAKAINETMQMWGFNLGGKKTEQLPTPETKEVVNLS